MAINLDQITLYTAVEASRILGKEDSYISQLYRKYPNRFPEGSIKKHGRELILTQAAIDKLRGGIMTRKVVWIESVNAQGGLMGGNSSTLSIFELKKFQDKLREVMGIDFDIEYIQLDIAYFDKIEADLIVVPDTVKGYLNLEANDKVVVIPYIDIKQKDFDSIKNKIQKSIN